VLGLQKETMNQPKLLYIYDALCGWCYGFSPVMQQLHEEYQDHMDFEVISGGMVTGERIGPIGEVAGYIGEAYKQVEQSTGVRFGEGFLQGILEPGEAIFTSVPPAIAMQVVKAEKPGEALHFAHLLQTAIYYDGIAPADYDAYVPYAEQVGLQGTAFRQKMEAPDFAKAAEEEFNLSQQMGISGFPTLIAQMEDKYYLLARGFLPYESVKQGFDKVLSLASQ